MNSAADIALIADDDPICRAIVHAYLRKVGWATVIEAGDGSEAQRAVMAIGARLGLVVSDISMPVADGVEFLGFLAGRRRDCPVIIVTGTAPAIARASAGMAKANGLTLLGLIAKPVTPDNLAAVVPRFVSGG